MIQAGSAESSKELPRSLSQGRDPPVFARKPAPHGRELLNKSLGFGARVQNLLSDLETRLPKLPMANDSRYRLPPQPSFREGREFRDAGPERTLGIANESRVIDAERRAKQQAAVDRRGVYSGFLNSRTRHQAPRRAGAPVRTPERDEAKWKPVFARIPL